MVFFSFSFMSSLWLESPLLYSVIRCIILLFTKSKAKLSLLKSRILSLDCLQSFVCLDFNFVLSHAQLFRYWIFFYLGLALSCHVSQNGLQFEAILPLILYYDLKLMKVSALDSCMFSQWERVYKLRVRIGL